MGVSPVITYEFEYDERDAHPTSVNSNLNEMSTSPSSRSNMNPS